MKRFQWDEAARATGDQESENLFECPRNIEQVFRASVKPVFHKQKHQEHLS